MGKTQARRWPELVQLRARMAEVHGLTKTERLWAAPVEDYAFATSAGEVRLSQLFGSKRDLVVVHLVGICCPMSMLWADGLSAVHERLARRVALVVASADDPAAQDAVAAARSWRFRMVGHSGTQFAADMGAVDETGRRRPALSVFRMRGGRLERLFRTGERRVSAPQPLMQTSGLRRATRVASPALSAAMATADTSL